MPNIQAKDATGATIYLASSKANTDLEPALSQESVLIALGAETNTTGPSTDTAAATVNGRLIRLAQRLTSLIGLFPTALGQATMGSSFPVVLASNQSAVPVSGTVSTGLSQPLTDAQLRATAVPVSGTVSTDLSQPLTDAQLRATAVPVSGTVSTGLSQPLTDAQLRATAVPVSGTVSTGLSQPLTDAQLRATAVAVEPLGIPGVARQLSATNTSVNTALTSTCRRISITALVDGIRFSIGSTSQTASTTSHFIAAGERLDFALPSTPNIAVLRAGAVNATLEVAEYL